MYLFNKQHLFYFSLAKNKESGKSCTSELKSDSDRIDNKDGNEDETSSKRREDLLMKLKSLTIVEDDVDSDIDVDSDDEQENDNFDSDVDDLSCDKKCSK